MSSTIDTKVVEARFDNAQFQQGIKSTLDGLDKLNKQLQLQGATKGLEHVTQAANNVSLHGIHAGVDALVHKFDALKVVGVTALATIAHQALSAGSQLVKSFTITPITDGFSEYQLKLGSIQTILANTAKFGTTLPQVNAALNALNDYSDKTIYNFGAMTKNIGLFTNAGLKLEESVSMIKGFSNAAAASGTSAEGAAAAAYQLSQALSAGQIRLMDWRSLTNVGLGNKNMQNSLIDIADAMGSLSKHGVKAKEIQANFNGTLEKGWLTADVMSKYLRIMAGDMTDAQMAALGLSKSQIAAFKAQQKTAEEAATKVRTLSQLMGTLKEAVASGWSQTFELLFGGFNEATTLFTNISDVLGGFVKSSAEARNKVLFDWKQLGGRKALIQGITYVFKALIQIIKPIRQAFREIFPAKTGKQLRDMTVAFRAFAFHLKIGAETSRNIKRTFAGIFAVFKIGTEIIKGVARLFFGLFSIGREGAPGILSLTAAVGDFLVKLEQWTVASGGIKKFFDGLVEARQRVLEPLVGFVSKLAETFGYFASGRNAEGVSNLSAAFSSLKGYVESVIGAARDTISTFADGADAVSKFFQAMGASDTVVSVFDKISSVLSDIADRLNFDPSAGVDMAESIVVGFANGIKDKAPLLIEAAKEMSGILVMGVKKVLGIKSPSTVFEEIGNNIVEGLKNGLNFQNVVAVIDTALVILLLNAFRKFWKNLSGLVGSIGGVFEQLTNNLKTMQNEVRAKAILEIAFALAILVGSLLILSKIDRKDLAVGLAGIAALLLMLTATMGGMFKMMKTLEGETPTSTVKLLAAGAAIVLLAGGILLLSVAVKIMSTMDMVELAKGLAAVALAIAAVTTFAKLVNGTKGVFSAAAAILILSFALITLSGAILLYSKIPFDTVANGGAKIAVILAAIGLSMRAFPKDMVKTSASLLLVSVALTAIAQVMKKISEISVGGLIKAVLALAFTMSIIVTAMQAAQTAMVGAQALFVVSAALLVLAKALEIIGDMDLLDIVKSLVTLVATIALLGAASVLLAPVIPLMLLMGAAIGLIGAAMLAAGAGMMLFSGGLAILASVGTAGFAVITAGISSFLAILPLIATQLGIALVAFIRVIGESGEEINKAMTKILMSFLKVIDNVVPKLVDTIGRFVMAMVIKITTLIPRIARAGLNMIVALLTAIRSRIGLIVDLVADIIVEFLNALSRNIPRIIQAGVNFILSFLNGIADAIRDNSEEIGAAGGNIATAMVEGMVNGLKGSAKEVINAAADLASHLPSWTKKILGIKSPSKVFEKIGNQVNQGFANGLRGNRSEVFGAFEELRSALKDAMRSSKQDIADAEDRLKKLTSARKKDVDAINKATAALAQARKEHDATSDAYAILTKNLVDERNKLGALANSYDKVAAKLEAASQKLEDAKKTRDDYNRSIADQYSDLPEITATTRVSSFIGALQKQINDTKAFASALQILRRQGLNDTLYKELLAKGTDALPFVNQLVAGGPEAISQINTLGSQLEAQAKALGRSASSSLYQAAVDSAAGLVAGLKKEQKNIQKQMDIIAASMVKAIKKALGIKSPSKEFENIGAFASKGLALGLKKQGYLVDKASMEVGTGALETMKKSMAKMSDIVAMEIDTDPSIRPVLDLSRIKKDSTQIDSMLSAKQLGMQMKITTSASKAKEASNAHHQNETALLANAKMLPSQQKQLTFIQNNNSPKALSSADIYRQTKNQLSVAKEALK